MWQKIKKSWKGVIKRFRWYQRDAFKFLLKHKHAALYMEMRLGKTFVLVKRILMFLNKEKDLVLIIGPYSTFNSWRTEFKELNVSICEIVGTRPQRLDILRDALFSEDGIKYNIFITNKEAHKRLPEIKDIPWRCVILDEAHFIKNPKANVTKFFLKNFNEAEFRYILTGTPISNTYLDYFCQLKFLLKTGMIENNWYEFQIRYFITVGYKSFPTKQGREYLANLLKNSAFVLTLKQAGLENKPIESIREVKLTNKIQKMYDKAVEDWIWEYKQERKLTKWILVQFHWLRRISGGVLTDGEILHTLKMEELDNLFQGELLRKRVVIWCRYTDETLQVYKYLKKLKYRVNYIIGKVPVHKRDKIIHDFNDHKYQILIAQPVCLKEGTDLSAVNTAIYYSLPDGHITKKQVDARINNVDKKTPLFIIYLMCTGSVDFKILKGLRGQEKYSNIMLDYVKELSNEN